MCISQFNLYLVVLVVAILPITRLAIASHNLARFNPGIKQTQSRNPGIGKTVRDCIPYLYVCLSVCLLARLLKNSCMDLDEILHVDRGRDMDELINF